MTPEEMDFEPGHQALVTCDNWFTAPDGKDYKVVYGTVKDICTAEATLGIKPNGKSTNWYMRIGNMILAGCQIHYIVKASKVNLGPSENWTATADGTGKITKYERPSIIYNADAEAGEN